MKKTVKPVYIINIAFFLGIASILAISARMTMGSDRFRIKDIICREAIAADFNYLKEKNIFTLDLKRESARLSAYYPHYKKVRLVRIMPNQVYIDFLRRRPVAYVKLHRNYYIDEELFLFDIPGPGIALDLPVIYGLDKKFFGVKPGKRYNIPELESAVAIIKEIRSNRALDNFHLKRIDLKSHSDVVILGSLALTIRGNSKSGGSQQYFSILEVRMPQDNMRSKIGILSSLFDQDKENLGKIKYIDLRFKEPVVKFKNAA